jgi:D-psicose/D-tagatose/L-ribulose 3-epimerase
MIKGLAVSNIAWSAEDDLDARNLLVEMGIEGVEVAPARVVSDFEKINKTEIIKYRDFWASAGLEIPSMQALLFGGPGGNIFGGKTEQNLVRDHLLKVFYISEHLGAEYLVFGSPKNRQRLNMSSDHAFNVACEFFFEMGEKCLEHGIKLCIEPNPTYYKCDFINTSDEAFALNDSVNSRGFGVHLDAAGMCLAEEPVEYKIKQHGNNISHFHISEKDLATIGTGNTPHNLIAAAIKQSSYTGWLSVEMLKTKQGLKAVKKSLEYVVATY